MNSVQSCSVNILEYSLFWIYLFILIIIISVIPIIMNAKYTTVFFRRIILQGGADNSLARLASRCRRTESILSLERGSVHVPNCKTFLFTDAERKHVRRHARFQQHRDASCHQFYFLQGKEPKEIHAILKDTSGEHAPSYGTVKNWVVQFKRGDFSTCDAPRPGRHKTVTTP